MVLEGYPKLVILIRRIIFGGRGFIRGNYSLYIRVSFIIKDSKYIFHCFLSMNYEDFFSFEIKLTKICLKTFKKINNLM